MVKPASVLEQSSSPPRLGQPLHEGAEPLPGYRLLRLLGRGCRGEVWKCEAPDGISKAIKFLPAVGTALGGGGCRLEEVLEALQRLKSIRHPGLLFLDRFKVLDDTLVLVMELADRNLADVLVQCRSAGLPGVPRDVLLAYLAEAAEILDALNRQYGLRHLALKPQQLLLSGKRIKVSDIGLVAADASAQPAGVASVYSAPEVLQGASAAQSDQYSLALIYQELLTGRPPGSSVDLSGLPDSDWAILARALNRDPGQRFSSCSDFVQALVGEPAPSESVPETFRAGTPPSPVAVRSLTDYLATTCASLPGYRFVTCIDRQPAGELWVVELPDGRTRWARIAYGFGNLDPVREEEAVKRLRTLAHAALLRLESCHTEPGRLTLITEVPERALRERLVECQAQRLPGIPRLELLNCLEEAATALDELYHDHHLQHLGLNPGNVLLHRGRVRLTDFGLAQLLWLPAGQPVARFNARYAAPELFQRQVSRSADQYSLALIYHELLTGLSLSPGRRPRTSDRSRSRPSLALLPSGERQVLARALNSDPRRRFQSCTELVQALRTATEPREADKPRPAKLPVVISWPPVAEQLVLPDATLPSLDRVLPGLLSRLAGPVQVREYQNIPYLIHPGQHLAHRCAAWLPGPVAELKLRSFAQEWRAEIVEGVAPVFRFHVYLPTSFWLRCLGREMGLEVRVELEQPAAPAVKLTEVKVLVRPLQPGVRGGQLLWEMGPALVESLRGHLQASPEQRGQPRLPCTQPVRVSPIYPGLQLAQPLDCRSKDISSRGIGLLLPQQLATPQVYLNLAEDPDALALGVLARVVRMQPCGNGWFEVGASFPLERNERHPQS